MAPTAARREQVRNAASVYYQKNKAAIQNRNKESQARKRACKKQMEAYDDVLPPSDAMSNSDHSSARSTPFRDLLSNRSPSPSPSSLDSTYCAHNSNDRNSPTAMSGIDLIRNVRTALANWTAALGPVEDWPRVFREQYDEACVNTTAPTTQAAIDIFLGQVGEHVRVGKDIIVGLERFAAFEHPQVQSATADGLLVGDMLRTLHRGVAVLEARLELYAPSGAHVSPLQSAIRRHEEFIT